MKEVTYAMVHFVENKGVGVLCVCGTRRRMRWGFLWLENVLCQEMPGTG